MAPAKSTLAPGLYSLTEDVKNPHADRRIKYDWRYRATFTKGTRFEVFVVSPSNETIATIKAAAPTMTDWSSLDVRQVCLAGEHRRIPEDDFNMRETFAAVAAKLTPAEMDLDAALIDVDYEATLRALVEAGKVTLADIMEHRVK